MVSGLSRSNPRSEKLAAIRASEARAARAWPAIASEPLDGWRLRFNHGLHRRVNSVLAIDDAGELAFEDKLARAEAYYRERTLPPRFQVSPACLPRGLDQMLAARGYVVESGVDVQWTTTGNVLAALEIGSPVRLLETPHAEWMAVHMADATDKGIIAGKFEMLKRIEPAHVFVQLEETGAPKSVGIGIFDDGWTGLFGMHTLAASRRRGYAQTLVAALARWTEAKGGRNMYLQVEQDNPEALRFYEKAGFKAAYAYHYRRLDG